MEAPHSWCDVRFTDLTEMSRCLDPDGSLGGSTLEQHILAWCGVLVDPDSEEDELRHRQWSTHELWFHERSRRYGREHAFGGTFWAKDKFAPPPLRPAGAGNTVPFGPTDPGRWHATSTSLHTVLEDRRSTRRHDDSTPMTRARLGEFLYRTARLRLEREVDGVEYGSKPYPSGGSVYEIELFLLIRNVVDVAPGLWMYDPVVHGLAPVREGLEDPSVAALLREATHSSTVATAPQVTLLMAPRFGRILWKYEQMGYAVMLKHVGVLMQTMYLVATDMGLAACAIGSGDSDLFSRATGLDPLECTTVGEFLLGSPHPDEPFQERPA
ncbi:SagB family peptide dehydrogenase [Isoptericola halotolerans]|uniref:SagB/ThcOx family dehydrogenase n=1 Tax=Isoptericola halotolerans TaxID=300560 RepID=UPI00388F8594